MSLVWKPKSAADTRMAGLPLRFLEPGRPVRRVFGLTDGVSLPSVSNQPWRYYDYLAASLSLPFEALCSPTTGEIRQLIHYVRVVVTDPSQSRNHNLFGLFCRHTTRTGFGLPLAALGVRRQSTAS